MDLANGYSQGPNSSLVEKSDPTQQTPNSRDVGEDSSLAVVSCEGTIGSYQYAEQEREGAFDRERLRLKLKLDRLLVRLKACIRVRLEERKSCRSRKVG